jgi:hypothetical protein
MTKIAHIINPVIVGRSSDLFVAQPITFETMKAAREFARGQVEVELFSAQYPEDRALVPEYIQMTPDLERSVLDLGTFQKKRKLPLIKDILDRLYEATDADYLIYTNVDIALMPHFYVSVNQLIDQGYDAFVINRRTISNAYRQSQHIPLMYAQAGKSHPGHDCFVFKRDVYPDYYLGNVCIGATEVGKTLNLNLICHANRFKEFKYLHLTFHIGDDRIWQSPANSDYCIHNENELFRVVGHYEAGQKLPNHPLVKQYRVQMEDQMENRTLSFFRRMERLVDRLKDAGKRRIAVRMLRILEQLPEM